MIVLRKDKLTLVEPTAEVMTKPPAPFDFEKDGDSAINVSNVLFERMKQLGGIGLSANQVGLDMRVFVMGLGETKIAVFNPEILEHNPKQEHYKEGCLSYPGIMLTIKRPTTVKVRYQNEKGEVVENEFNGLTARVFQHEFDHMSGYDFTRGVSKFKLDFAKKQFENKRKKIVKKYAVKTMIDALNSAEDAN
jgi:peptide deformylase